MNDFICLFCLRQLSIFIIYISLRISSIVSIAFCLTRACLIKRWNPQKNDCMHGCDHFDWYHLIRFEYFAKTKKKWCWREKHLRNGVKKWMHIFLFLRWNRLHPRTTKTTSWVIILSNQDMHTTYQLLPPVDSFKFNDHVNLNRLNWKSCLKFFKD